MSVKEHKEKGTIKCQRCQSSNVKQYSARHYCLMCGWTWHQLSESSEQEILTRIETITLKRK